MRNKIKVLHVTGSSPFGGATEYVLLVCKMLKERGFETVWLTSDLMTIEVAKNNGIRVISNIYIPRRINLLLFISFFQLFHLFKRERFDIVHTHTSTVGFVGRISAKLAKTPLVIHTIHGFAFHEFSSSFIKLVYSIAEKIAGKFMDMGIFVNNEDREDAVTHKLYDVSKVKTVLNGIPIPHVAPCSLYNKSAKSSQIIVGFVGRLAKQKGLEDLLKAARVVADVLQNVKFWIVGTGELQKNVEETIGSLKLRETVSLLGFRRDVDDILNCIDIFVLPSFWEGLSIMLLEAMAHKKAIIATNIKGNREVISNLKNGILVEPGNSEELAKAIIKLIQDEKLRERLGAKAQEDFLEHFTSDRMITEICEIYLESLRRKGYYI